MMSTPINSDRAKLQAARGLINERRYAEARALLVSVNDPQAVDWIMKIDAMQPVKHEAKPRSENHTLWGAVSLIAFVAAVGFILLAVTSREFANQAYGGMVGIAGLLIAYFSRRKAK